jgi:hypothetical protein
MDIGDRVVYVLNDEIDLNRDVGTIASWEDLEQHWPQVLFADGETLTVDRCDLKPLVEKTPPQKPMHLHFGCSEDPCRWPGHS